MTAAIGIMAGSGQFPFLVARGAKKSGLRVVACGFHDNTDPALEKEVDAFIMLHLGQLNRLIDFFKSQKVRRVCMAGAISKPKALDLKPDLRVARLIFKLAGKPKGDDVLLRVIAEELQNDGLTVVRPDELAPGLHCPPGVLGAVRPSAEVWQDIRFGRDMARRVGALDIGQCVVVLKGIVAAVEALEGTDACIARGGELGGAGCTVVKALKPGQDERLDLPSIGLATIALLARYKFACLAFDAAGTLFFDQEAALAEADRHGIAVVALPPDGTDIREDQPAQRH